eukprot:TRINITY_DN13825_c0_g1_i4.p1 TRINITY_DN13825_c0_g1~~TRINITY_DN13825_c0_g1_i4.p1  ORF type:complete len:160 (-),score=57.62 TRINITY_DN13825_c0_g1_i4:237-716(-)
MNLEGLELRPWTSLIDAKELVPPKNAAEAQERALANLKYYKGNYAVFAAVVLALTAYFSSYFLIAVAISGGVGGALFFLKDLKLGARKVNETEKAGVTAVVALLSLYLLESFSVLFYAALVIALGVGAHAALRKNTLKTKATNLASDVQSDIKKAAKSN